MKFFDLHCDTLYEIYKQKQDLYENNCHVSIKRSKYINKYIGCFAIWMPDNYRGSEALCFFDNVYKNFLLEKDKNSFFLECINKSKDMDDFAKEKIGVILTVEGGSVLGGDINRIKYLKHAGVKVITLTWNGPNEIGDGCRVLNSRGITDFGIKAVKEMEKAGIVIDISHASEHLFYDVANISKKPFIATHSNSYSVCSNKRNLTDEQFRIIRDKGGIVGITFCKKFLNSDKDASLSDIIKHIEHFLALSGEKVLSIGSDFDGADIVNGISGIQSMEILCEYLLKHNYNDELIYNIFYNNAYKFFQKMI